MASAFKIIIDGIEYIRVVDTGLGRRLQYTVKLGNSTPAQWLNAHGEVMQTLELATKQQITNKELKKIVASWMQTPKSIRSAARLYGINPRTDAVQEMDIKSVFAAYLSEYSHPELNSPGAIQAATNQCFFLLEFLEQNNIAKYSHLKRDAVKGYLSWRKIKGAKAASASTVNKELQRLAAVIKYGVKYHGWQELYLTDGIRVRQTQENTKTVRPFEIPDVKRILEWLRKNADLTGNWYLHDMALLSFCTGMEAKALSLLQRDWFKLELGILRVYDKLVSGVLDAKTQNRARDIPLTPTIQKIYERGFIFNRPAKNKAIYNTAIHDYSRKAFARCERETGIKNVDWHRFRHTCATARLSAGWQLVRVSRLLGHSSVNTTAKHYAEYDLSASPEGFGGMLKAYGDFVRWLDEGILGNFLHYST